VQSAPLIEPTPSNDDQQSEAASKAAKAALDIIKNTTKYDLLRVYEALNLRLFGNSFRYAYYSKDPRYGYINADVYQDVDVILSHGSSVCPVCGPMEGIFPACPACGMPIQQSLPPVIAQMAKPVGTVKYPKGEVMTEVVNPLEVYVRSSSLDLWHAPFLVRNRVVDRMALQSTYPDINLNPRGDEGGGEAYSVGGDLSLIYLQSLADLPGDTTQYAAWYERATAAAKALLIEGWVRPGQYFFDKELAKKYPDGLYGAKTGDTLLEARNDTIENHWTHFPYNPCPGRFWGDGDDDLIAPQLKLDETDRLIQRNQGYNAAPLLVIDSQRIDKNVIINDPSTIIEAKASNQGVENAVKQLQSMPLSQETWQWRNAHLSDMYFHSRVSPSSAGLHQPGVNSYGGQESAASKTDESVLPNLFLWKSSDESWARQALKLAAENWIDERVHAVQGINGKWEFDKLRGAALNLDQITLVTRVMPVDPKQQQALSEAVASGLLDPQDPRVKRKAMELYHLPTELDAFYKDAKVQWKEIEKMKQGQQVQPMLIRDNDQIHIEICREWLNSDEADDMPQLVPVVLQHAQAHIMNMAMSQQMQAAVQAAGAQAQQAISPQANAVPPPGGPPGGGPPGGPGGKKPEPQAGHHGGQVPPNPVERQQRAHQGAAQKPNRPQPPEGNQYHVQRQT
jgi:hypothetical protein